MGMFDNYDKLNPDYIPDNTSPEQSHDYVTFKNELPRVSYNIKGNPIGLSWCYGDEFELKFTAKQKIKVAENSITYTTADEAPGYDTEGVASQQAYNTVDCKSWTCVGVSSGHYIWIEDDDVIYSLQGTKEIEMIPDMEGKTLVVDIYNFRWEPVHSISALSATDVSLYLNKDLSEIFKPGTYYSVLKIQGEEDVIVRDKVMLIVE